MSQQVKLPPTTLTSHTQVPVQVLAAPVLILSLLTLLVNSTRGSKCLGHWQLMIVLDGVSDSWLHPGAALAVMAIIEVNQLVEDLSVSPSLR